MDEPRSIVEQVAQYADFANAVANLVCGHRKILVEGEFEVHLADQMAAALHSNLLGLVYPGDPETDFELLEMFIEEEDDE